MRLPRRRDHGKAATILIVVGVIFLIIVICVVVFAMWAVGVNNRLVSLNQNADASWAQVQNVYQRRMDLIPNLVNTVKGAASHEFDVQVGVVRERAKATQMQINPSNPDEFNRFAQQQQALGGALSRLLVTVEKYPEIRANQNFLTLQQQIEGTENRISVERDKFNKAVMTYNNEVLMFPGSFIAAMRNFKQRPYFTAAVEAQTAPTVDFGPSKISPTPAVPAEAPSARITTASHTMLRMPRFQMPVISGINPI